MLINISLEQSNADASVAAQERAAHIIETQAIRISAKQILPSIPDNWPLPLMESFLIRSMRRNLHERYEEKLIKALLQGQMTDLSLRYYDIVEKLGGTLAEEASDDEGAEPDEKTSEIVYLEKQADLDEKAVELL